MLQQLVDIWPHTEFTNGSFRDCGFVEDFFNRFYAPFRTLYFSRGRVATTAILQACGASRNDLVFVQPFSSYCVQSSVSKVATPLTIHPEESKFQIVYHNFGKKEIANKEVFKHVILEDSVDSLIICNKEEELFPNGADYAIFSLAKMIHVPFGSIVVCKTDEAYERLKNVPLRTSRTIQDEVVNLTNPLFTDCILTNNALMVPDELMEESLAKLFKTSVQTIQHNLSAISELTGVDYTNPDRLPSNVFSNEEFPVELYDKYQVAARSRHVYDYQTCSCLSVNMFPVHADVVLER